MTSLLSKKSRVLGLQGMIHAPDYICAWYLKQARCLSQMFYTPFMKSPKINRCWNVSILSFRRVLYVECFLPRKMEPIEGSETSAFKPQTPGKYPKENILQILESLILKYYVLIVSQKELIMCKFPQVLLLICTLC